MDGKQAQYEVFAVLWAICLLFDLSNRGMVAGPAQVLATGSALAVLLRPRLTALLALASLATLLNLATRDTPFLFVHWYFDALVSLTLLGAWLTCGLRHRGPAVSGAQLLDAAGPPLRVMVLLAVGFAGFAKLNATYLDVDRSCGSALYLSQAGFLISARWARWVAIVLSLLAELAVPLMVLSRRLRPAGMVLATGFFFLLSINPIGNLYEFACPMLALLTLFTAPATTAAARDRITARIGERVPLAWLGRSAAVVWVVAMALSRGTWGWQGRAWSCEVLVCLGLPLLLAAYLWHRVPSPQRPTGLALLRGGAAVAWVLPLVMWTNEISPYLGYPHQPTFTMASDLRMMRSRSNHLLLRAPVLPHNAPVVITQSNDRFLRAVKQEDARLNWLALRWWLSGRPNAVVRGRVDGQPFEVLHAGTDPRFSDPPWTDRARQRSWLTRALSNTEQPPDVRCGHWSHHTVAPFNPDTPR